VARHGGVGFGVGPRGGLVQQPGCLQETGWQFRVRVLA